MLLRCRSFPVLCILLCPVALFADENHLGLPGDAGKVSFPISCRSGARTSFERGVALLHSFEYEAAQREFQTAAADDPSCAMSYWGQAMSLFHQLWERPPADDLRRGSELLKQAGAVAKRSTLREKEYIAALSTFYSDADQTDHWVRTSAYADAMRSLHEKYPQDTEARVFYALALLAASPDDDRSLSGPKKAVALLDPLVAKYPRHPGIAHYIIHSTDNPELAHLGLNAAQRYAAIASASPHAIHMPSHIFARLGLWQDSIKSNLAALQAVDRLAHMHLGHHRMHSLDFLLYAYLQIGDDRQAQAQIDRLTNMDPTHLDDRYREVYHNLRAQFAARYALERSQWQEVLSLHIDPNAPPYVRAVTYLAQAIAAGHLQNAEVATRAAEHYDAMIEATRQSNKPYYAKQMEIGQKEATAWKKYANGDGDAGLALLRSAAEKQEIVGTSLTETPAREMLAEMQLLLHRPEQALQEYEKALKTDPNRFNGLAGAARAARAAGSSQKAAHYLAQLEANCKGVRSDRPELTRSRNAATGR